MPMNEEIMTLMQRELVLSVFPPGSKIINATHFQNKYLPAPMRVDIKTPSGCESSVVLRLARHGSVEFEILVLRILAEKGLPVPEVLAGSVNDPDMADYSAVAVYSFLPGITVQNLSQQSSDACKTAARLVVEGACRLADLTDKLKGNSESAFLSTTTLSDRLESVVNNGGPWLDEAVFAKAVNRLRPVLEDNPDVLVFSGGDYQPANFLTDGHKVTGFIDFEMAGYHDFLFGFAKYPIYDIHPLNKCGFVSFLLREKRIDRRDFAIRLALGCLVTLQKEIPVTGPDEEYRKHVVSLLGEAMKEL